VDFESTLRLAARLHPNLHRMIVIGDRSVTGAAIQRQIREVVPRLQGILDMEFWDDLPLGEIMERLGTMPKNAMLFVIPVYLERDGKLYSADEVVELISTNVSLPVYSCWRFLLGHGLVGGRLHSGVDHGRMAASQAVRIMTGEKPANVPVVDRFDDPYAFDYVVLRKLDIPMHELPGRLSRASLAEWSVSKGRTLALGGLFCWSCSAGFGSCRGASSLARAVPDTSIPKTRQKARGKRM